MKKLSPFVLISGMLVLLSLFSCEKPPDGDKKPGQDGQTPAVAIYASTDLMNLPVDVRATHNGTKNPLHLHSILLPYNCSVSFIIVNEGPEGTVLNYSIDDTGALGGFLDYTNGSGSLKSGGFATITVSVDPDFTKSGLGGLGGSTLVLNINTPGASNYTKNIVSVHIIDFDVEVQKLIGTWKGTWTGFSYGPKKFTPVSGTWILNLLTIHWSNQSATASLTWTGTDAWWDYAGNDIDANNSMPHNTTVNLSLVFNHSISSISGARPCFDGVKLHLPHSKYFGYFEEVGYVPDPSNLDFHLDFSPDLKSIKVNAENNSISWSSRWKNPSFPHNVGYSNGFLNGSKLP